MNAELHAPSSREAGERIALAAFCASTLLAGANAVAIRFSNRDIAPFWGAALRFASAGGLLLLVMWVRRMAFPRGPALLGALAYGAFNFGAAFGLVYYALTHVQAGLGMTVLAVAPLSTLLLAVIQRQEALRLDAVIGAALGLVGVAIVSRASVRQGVPVMAMIALVASTLCFGQGGVIVRRWSSIHPVTVNAVGMTTGAACLTALSVLAGEPIALPRSERAWIAVAYLAVIGSIGVFVLYAVVLRYWTASRAAYQGVLIPVLTLALSAWLDDETLTPGLAIGGLVVLSGVYVGALRPRGRASMSGEASW